MTPTPSHVASLASIILDVVPTQHLDPTKKVVYEILIRPCAVKEKLRRLSIILTDGVHIGNWPSNPEPSK